MKLMVVFLVLASSLLGVCVSRHVHPRSIVHQRDNEFATGDEVYTSEIDGMPIEVIRNIKQSRFVPVNNEIFFKTYQPCDEGFKRDFLGICREVWD